MKAHKTTRRLAGLMIVGLMTVASAAWAAVPAAPPKFGPVWPGGGLKSGGTISYFATLDNVGRGTNVNIVVASITSSGWSPAFSNRLVPNVSGTQIIGSSSIPIPANFSGGAVLTVTLFSNGKKMDSKSVTFNVAKPGGLATTMYDVGFDQLVTLDPSFVNLGGFPVNPTFIWSQLSQATGGGLPVVLSSTTVRNPTFLTHSITNFIPAGTTNVITSESYAAIGAGSYSVLPATNKVPFRALGVVGINAQQVAASTYKFQVVASGGGMTKTGAVTVVCASASPGQRDVPVGVKTYFQNTNNVNGWSLVSAPAGSTAVLQNLGTPAPFLQPDLEGAYTLTNNIVNTNLVVYGAKWVGVQTCANCHSDDPILGQFAMPDMVTPWSQTRHASKFLRGVEGQEGAFYGEGCISCHTVGYNKADAASNDGFDDIASNLGWSFQSPPKKGNYANVPTDLKNMGGIQCESCHGPGSYHPGEKSTSLDVAVCATCHQDGHYHIKVEQWEHSPHARTDHLEFKSPATGCGVKCHSPQGFVDTNNGVSPARGGMGKIACAACHDPHNVEGYPAKAHQVRVYDSVTIDDGTSTLDISNMGTSALCVFCHNARRTAFATRVNPTGFPAGTYFYYQTSQSHESTSANIFLGFGGVVRNPKTGAYVPAALGNSDHTKRARCVTCHMAATPAAGKPGHNEVGEHTFNMASDGVENVGACNVCHKAAEGAFATIKKFDHEAKGEDYDGDKVANGVQTEVKGLMALVKKKIVDLEGINYPVGTVTTNSIGEVTSPFINHLNIYNSATLTAAQKEALHAASWNLVLVTRDLSHGIHNAQYTIALLQKSYNDLCRVLGGDMLGTRIRPATLR